MFLIEIAFDFSKYDPLTLQSQQMAIIGSLQSTKCLETLLCILQSNYIITSYV